MRRRARTSRTTKNKASDKEKLDKEEKDKDTTTEIEEAAEKSNSSETEKINIVSDEGLLAECGLLPKTNETGASKESSANFLSKTPVKNENIVNAEKMLFGFSLGKHHVSNIELDSDQESTDGEEDSMLKGEIPERLTPDWLLW